MTTMNAITNREMRNNLMLSSLLQVAIIFCSPKGIKELKASIGSNCSVA